MRRIDVEERKIRDRNKNNYQVIAIAFLCTAATFVAIQIDHYIITGRELLQNITRENLNFRIQIFVLLNNTIIQMFRLNIIIEKKKEYKRKIEKIYSWIVKG